MIALSYLTWYLITLPVSNFGVGIKANGSFVYRGVLLLDMIAMDAGGAVEPSDTELSEELCNLKAFNSPRTIYSREPGCRLAESNVIPSM